MWPFTTPYPQRSLRELEQEYDYIVVGGGTAGCVLARRLAEDRTCTVLLVERGDARDNWLDRFPLLSTHHWSDQKHSVSFKGDIRGGRTTEIIAGKGLGGTSRINGMQYTRGVPGEYNAWARSGRSGWSYPEMQPYFEKAEGLWSPVTQRHYGTDGLWQIEAPPPAFKFGVSTHIGLALEKASFTAGRDVNDPTAPSSGWFPTYQTTDQSGHRSSTFRAYLPEDFVRALAGNLHICTMTIARKVELNHTEHGELYASGVLLQAARPGGPSRSILARREVILACGALTTPQLLMLSGVGPAGHLRDLGIPVLHELDGVGSNLQDHMGTNLTFYCPLWDTLNAMVIKPWFALYQIFRYLAFGDGWLKDFYMEASVFTRSNILDERFSQKPLSADDRDSSRPENVPDIEIMTGAVGKFDYPGFDKSKGSFIMLATHLHPASRGTVRLRSSDPLDTPLVNLNFLSAPGDINVLRTAIRLCMRIADEMRASGYPVSRVSAPATPDDADVDAFIAEQSQSFLHYSSTCRMAPRDDPDGSGVVDDELRVHGIANLRVCDASIFPQVPAAHLQAPVVAVAEKCADMIKKAYQGRG